MRDVIVIGAPVGGASAIIRLARDLPSDLEASIFIVLHMPENEVLLSDLLNAPHRMRAADAIHGEKIKRRRIYVAPNRKHLRLRDGRIHLSDDGAVKPYRPSIDVLFVSAAESYGPRVVGVLLLHVNEDGLEGLKAIRAAGGCIVTHRNEKMPEKPLNNSSAALLANDHIDLRQIVARIISHAREEVNLR